MSKFYVYENASRRLRTGGFTFSFDVIEQFGGNWRGVLKLDDEASIAALSEIAVRLGVKEISEEEYDGWLKKKLNSRLPSPDIIRLPTSPLKVGVGHVVIKEPSGRTIPEAAITVSPKISSDEAITMGKAPYVDPLEERSKSKRRKPSTANL
jgi:hypothetical protein